MGMAAAPQAMPPAMPCKALPWVAPDGKAMLRPVMRLPQSMDAMNGTPKLEILYYQGYDLLEIQPSGSVLSPAEFE